MLLIYIIEGILGLFVLIAMIGAIGYGQPMTWKETDEDRIRRYCKKSDRERRRKRFKSISTPDGKTIFGYPMKDIR